MARQCLAEIARSSVSRSSNERIDLRPLLSRRTLGLPIKNEKATFLWDSENLFAVSRTVEDVPIIRLVLWHTRIKVIESIEE